MRAGEKGQIMDTAPHTVAKHIVLELVGPNGSAPVEGELRYDPVDPYAVGLVFFLARREVVWVFARDLLMRGAHEPVGDGDVTVQPSLGADGHAVITLELFSPEGRALVQAPAREVHEFLRQTAASVSPGSESEHLSLDEAITALLVGE